MKLTRSLDLDGLRAAAAEQVDAIYAARAARPLAGIHDLKATLAGQRDPLLKTEAAARGMSLTKFCDLVLSKRDEERKAILNLEAERLALKARIAASNNGHELRSIVETLSAPR